MWTFILTHAGYWAIIGLMMISLYIAFSAENLIKRLVGLSLFQTTICLFYVTLGKITGGTAPVLLPADMPEHGAAHGAGAAAEAHLVAGGGERVAELVNVYSNPLPHVLMLTAIVVGVATLSVGLALIVRIREVYGTIEADDVRAVDIETALAQEAKLESELKEATA
ncbi:MAG: NADH-quinone oxidoreductase [Hyphomonas sp.]|uniref:cation:proton antiporter subunit C n=1 Tax=Hyphomonas sp. TaxID=87 RepID=UPI0017DD5652|nr:cation:proton antiporter subunit C [Hyphomonas sp.]MBU3919150.1 cation:proton antiporter subunit C [Alphaproteobacteria bacterium]MBA3067723.1 NADH-quinone oxidoreductase [Hyphomonas sp.]MBU4062190.1 cation:proton antiporter subunit C [Alphaproteobacteria bacterium]MBU4165625.1 cation:proton antiporter subunit C [Alphaproteobacteria bacterium]MBU4569412.1 cation:proton antiporter subunit C [Alphaproteobacteria bacterium]